MKKIIFINILVLIFFAFDVYAKDNKSFFTKGSAKSIFLPTPKTTDNSTIKYFREKEEDEEEDGEEISDDNIVAEKNDNNETKVVRNENKKLSPSEKVVKEFGDPEKDLVYHPEEKAPAPFKGIMAALQIGDEELAYKYAKQYVEYSAKENELVNKTIQFQKLALEGLGRAQEGRYSNDADLLQYKYLLEKEKQEQEKERLKKENAKAIRLSKVDNSLFNSFDDAYKARVEKTNKEAISFYDELDARNEKLKREGKLVEKEESLEEKTQGLIQKASLQNEYQGRVPVDPKGEVSVYFFFRPNQKESIALGKHVEDMYKENVKEKNVHIVGVNVDNLPYYGFKQKAGANFPILNGDKLAKLMGVTSFPSIYFRCENSGQAFVFNKTARKDELTEILKLMRGGK